MGPFVRQPLAMVTPSSHQPWALRRLSHARLKQLLESGALSDEEFLAGKAAMMAKL